MFATYDDAAAAEISRSEAERIIGDHDCEGWQTFLADIGDKEVYSGQEILDWLGY